MAELPHEAGYKPAIGESEAAVLNVPGWIRDRRTAAADEVNSVAGIPIYGRGSIARRAGPPSAASARYDRGLASIRAVVLHQTAGATFMSERQALPPMELDSQRRSRHRIDRITAHFVVLLSGVVIYTHDVGYILNDAGGRHGIDIEFCGRFGHDSYPRRLRLTLEAIRAGRKLLKWLNAGIPSLDYIHPHGQIQAPNRAGVHGKLHSCPGPDIWVNVGEWAVRRLDLTASPVNTGLYRNDWTVTDRQSNPAYDQDAG